MQSEQNYCEMCDLLRTTCKDCREPQEVSSGYNVYEYKFVATCPNDGDLIYYVLKIVSTKMIMAEHIAAHCKMIKQGFQERIADDIHGVFGGAVQLTGTHRDVRIVSVRFME